MGVVKRQLQLPGAELLSGTPALFVSCVVSPLAGRNEHGHKQERRSRHPV